MKNIALYIAFTFSVLGSWSMDTLDLHISAVNLQKLESWRSSALKQPIISPKFKEKVPASVYISNQLCTGEVRLKGDWTDHLDSEKWSLRIKLDSAEFHGMQRFSIQHPKTRGYLFESIFHQLLAQENILTTRYEFVHVKLNGEYKGIYALEEHFDAPLLANAGKENGPILKFDETAFWEFQAYYKKFGEDIHFEYPMFQEAEILPFRRKMISSDSSLWEQFLLGRNKLHALRNFEVEKLNEIIDVDLFARYYALCALVGKDHGLNWHNQRFYFNPKTELLEPVAYDCWIELSLAKNYNSGLVKSGIDTIYFADVYFNAQLFNDTGFKKAFLTYIKQHLKNKKLVNKVKELIGQNDSELSLLDAEYNLSKDQLAPYSLAIAQVNKAIEAQQDLPEFRYISYNEWKHNHPDQVWTYKKQFPLKPFNKLDIMAFTKQIKDSTKVISIRNISGSSFNIYSITSPSGTYPIQALLKYDQKSLELEVSKDALLIEYYPVPENSVIGKADEIETFRVKVSPFPYYQNWKK